MKAFAKDGLTTVVEDDDRRIESYIANGWKETKLPEKQKDEADKRTEKAIDAANASEDKKVKGGKKGKAAAPDKKVNDAVAATEAATADSEAVDDGLLTKTEGKTNG